MPLFFSNYEMRAVWIFLGILLIRAVKREEPRLSMGESIARKSMSSFYELPINI
jgi:hypothetical protein